MLELVFSPFRKRRASEVGNTGPPSGLSLADGSMYRRSKSSQRQVEEVKWFSEVVEYIESSV